jgi:hypothetical protein
MRYQALATDYDSTLADSGRVDGRTLDALDRVRASGRKLILVTGRELPDLLDVFPQVDLFNRVVAENGALLFNPESLEQTLLAEPLPGSFLSLLRARQVPFAQGRVILATDSQHESAVSQLIGQLDLDLHIVGTATRPRPASTLAREPGRHRRRGKRSCFPVGLWLRCRRRQCATRHPRPRRYRHRFAGGSRRR